MLFWVSLILFINGVATFAYAAASAEPSVIWAGFATSYVYFLGITQTGIAFSAIMRVSKSGWGRHFSRLGEILTLSFIPVGVAGIAAIYLGGMEHLFWWVKAPVPGHGHGTGHHLSPWLNRNFFLWRHIVTFVLFYGVSFIYFRLGREEERGRPDHGSSTRLNVLAAFVMVAFVAINTNISWDFGMTIIEHWESSIFPPMYWVGTLLAGSAFIYVISHYFMPRQPGEPVNIWHLDSFGNLLLGFAMLNIYMFWSQNVVFWYTDLPNLAGPFFKQRSGRFAGPFIVMMLFIFIIPFLTMIVRKIKLCRISLTMVAVLVAFGMWINRCLMVMPVFTDGDLTPTAMWTALSLLVGGGASVVLSLIIFRKAFPDVPFTIKQNEGKGH